MLLVYDEEADIPEFDVFLQEGVRANDNFYLASRDFT
jgi:hypothetical protein